MEHHGLAISSELEVAFNGVEIGGYATDPIVTEGSAVIRSAESTLESFSRSGNFTVASSHVLASPIGTNRYLWQLSDGTLNNRIRAWINGSGNLEVGAVVAGAGTATLNLGAAPADAIFNLKAWHDGTNLNASLDGGATVSAIGAIADTTQIGYGVEETSTSNQQEGWVRFFDYWSRVV